MANPDSHPSGDRPLNEELQVHERCMRVLADLENCLNRAGEGAAWVKQLQSCVDSFSGALRSHFEAEEKGRLYRELPSKYPHLADRIGKLQREHAHILGDLDEVIGKAKVVSGEEELAELQRVTRDLLTSVQLHEQKEVQLFQSAYWRENGAGD